MGLLCLFGICFNLKLDRIDLILIIVCIIMTESSIVCHSCLTRILASVQFPAEVIVKLDLVSKSFTLPQHPSDKLHYCKE